MIAATEDDLTGIAGVSLWGELLDRLGLVAEADRRVLRPIGPGGGSGGERYRAVEGSRFSYKGEVQMSPLVGVVGVVGETGDVLAIRARGGNASPRKKLASFVDECVAAIPEPWRSSRQLWIRIDSAGYSRAVIDAVTAHSAAFSITCGNDKRVRGAIYELATSTETTWVPALSADGELAGSEVAECRYALGGVRPVIRRCLSSDTT